jgi:hypothetical protein
MKKTIAAFYFCLSAILSFSQELSSPAKFLGYPLGSQFTPYFKIVNYFHELANEAPAMLKLEKYGETYEGRPLLLAYISAPENLQKLELIRLNNLRLAGVINDQIAPDEHAPAIVWLSYNVHGNEAASSEAAMKTLYELVNPENAQVKDWLKNTIVIINPCLNPDGRDHYVNWYNSIQSKKPNADPRSVEHDEPWPGGRTNHYHFDLNRDWAWQTQIETQYLLKKYNEWLPQVHVDFHEQGYNDPYYFAPAAEPYHEVITAWQREFQVIIGKNNANYFDRKGWLYFTKEIFDLFYPSYGDTYPMYNGAIGMTFEQGGIAAGLAIKIEDGDTLTLADRLLHHYTTGMSTIEVSSIHAIELIREFHKYFVNAQSAPTGEFKSYLIKADPAGDRLERLMDLLNRNLIRWSYAIPSVLSGLNYETGGIGSFNVDQGDIFINANQPKSNLIKVLFERNTKISDSATYDITAWSVPFVYGLKAYGLMNYLSGSQSPKSAVAPLAVQSAYAYAFQWKGLNSAKFLAYLLNKGVKLRAVEQPFRSGNQEFDKGAMIIAHTGNSALGANLEKIIEDGSRSTGVTVSSISSGFVEKGFDFGSSRVHFIHKPRVALISGNMVSSSSAGEIWHLFEQQLDYPLTMLSLNETGRINWNNYDVLIMPNGSYPVLNEKEFTDNLKNWIQEGGRLIALENAVTQLAKTDFGIKLKTIPEPKKEEEKGKNQDYSLLHRYENRDRDPLVNSMPGSIYKVELDNSHPLAFGYPAYYYTLKQDDKVYEFLKTGGWNVGIIKKDNYISGFAGSKVREKLKDGLIFGVQDLGRGSIVYLADDPLFRSFWEDGKLLFCNAIFQVGQ